MFSPKLSDNANVNLVKLGERFVAMTETPIPVQFDAETLARRGRLRRPRDADDRPSAPRPRERGHAQLRGRPRAAQSSIASSGRVPTRTEPSGRAGCARASPPTCTRSGSRERWLVLAEFPFVVNPLRLAFSGRPYIENYRWKPELGNAVHASRPRDGRGAADRFRDRPLLRLSPRQCLRRGRRRGRRHVRVQEPGSSRTSTWSGCAQVGRSPSAAAALSRLSRRPAVSTEPAAGRWLG